MRKLRSLSLVAVALVATLAASALAVAGPAAAQSKKADPVTLRLGYNASRWLHLSASAMRTRCEADDRK